MSCSFTLEYYSTPDGRMDNENPVAVVLWLISVNFRMFTTITPTMWRTCLSLVLNSIVLLRNKKRPSHFSAYTGKHLANRLKNSSVTIYTKKRSVFLESNPISYELTGVTARITYWAAQRVSCEGSART